MNATAPTAPEPDIRHAPIALWRIAETFIRTLHMLFGPPEDIAACTWIDLTRHRMLASWLSCAEALLRRLLLIEAGAYPKVEVQARQRTLRKRVRKTMSFTADKPEEWRTTFRCLSSPASGGSVSARSAMTMGATHAQCAVACGDTSPASGGGKLRARSAWPIAERYEAILRVFNDPAPYAKRLARKLHAAPERIADLMRAPEKARDYVPDWPVVNHKAETEAHTFTKPQRGADSS